MTRDLCVRLVAGESGCQEWAPVAATGPTHVLVGSDPGCDWHITGQGVAPRHAMLVWDKDGLSVVQTDDAEVFVNGTLITGWRKLDAGWVEFGDAALEVRRAMPLTAPPENLSPPGFSGARTVIDLPRPTLTAPSSFGESRATRIVDLPLAAAASIMQGAGGAANDDQPPHDEALFPVPPIPPPVREGMSRRMQLLAVLAVLVGLVVIIGGRRKQSERAPATDNNTVAVVERPGELGKQSAGSGQETSVALTGKTGELGGALVDESELTIAGDELVEATGEASADRDENGRRRPRHGRLALTAERVAVNLLLTGHHKEALAHYRVLLRSRPKDRALLAMVTLLEERLAASCDGELQCQ